MELAKALDDNDLPALHDLLAKGADPNAVAPQAWFKKNITPLFRAVYYRDLPAVKELLAAGADPNSGGEAYAPAFVAVIRDRPDILRALLDAGANPRITRDRGIYGEQSLIDVAHAETIPMLLQYGFDPNKRTNEGANLLHIVLEDAVVDNKDATIAAVRALLGAGANMMTRRHHDDPRSLTPMNEIFQSGLYYLIPIFAENGYPITEELLAEIPDENIRRQTTRATSMAKRAPLLALRKERKEARYAAYERGQTAGRRRRRRTLRKRK